MLRLRIVANVWLLLVLFGLAQSSFLASPVDAASSDTKENITMTAAVGLDTTARIGFWVPVQVTMVNNGPDFSGLLSLRPYSGTPRAAATGVIVSSQRFEQAVMVPRGTQQVVTIAVPLNVGSFNPRGVRVELLDKARKTVALQWQRTYALNVGDVLVGVLSDQHMGLGPLNAAQFPSSANTLITASLDATTLPESGTVLNNLNALIIENFDTKSLNAAQSAAIQTWVNQGGALIEVGGAAAERTLMGLPTALTPVQVQGVKSFPSGTHLLPDEQPPIADTLPSPVVVSTGHVQAGIRGVATTLSSMTVLSQGTTPLFVQRQVGSGSVSYLAFDPMVDPLLNWSGTSALWSHVLLRALGDQLLISGSAPHFTSGPGQLLARGGLLAMIQPSIGFSFFTLILLFLGYVLVLGPLMVLLLRRLRKPFWLWRIMLAVIVLFSLLSYGLAYYQRGASLLNNTISLLQLNQNGTMAHITTYMGIYAPDQGDYHVHIPLSNGSSNQSSLAQALMNAQWFSSVNETYGDPNANVSYNNQQTRVDINGAGQWTFHTLIMEQDRQLQGSLLSQLTLHNKQVLGSITNTLPTGVSDVALLMPHSLVMIGHLNAGETKQIAAPLTDFSTAGNTTQANQLTLSNDLPANYFPYMQNQQPQTTTQRHMALLQALSGAGYNFVPCNGPCVLSTVINKQSIITPASNVASFHPNNGSDPLLLSGTPATLLAWADQPVDGSNDITINNTTPHGQHDNLLQVPSMVAFDPASTHVLPDTLTAHVVSAQGSNVVYTAPNIYAIGGGSSATFEFTLAAQLNAVQFDLSSASATPQPSTKQQGGLSTANVLQAQLYNWQMKTWDTLSVHGGRVSVSQLQPYVGPSDRILLQVSNQDASSSILLLSKPSLLW